PVMRVAEGMDIAHRPGNLTGRDLENRRAEGRIEVPGRPRLNLAVAALLDERGQPPNLELAPHDNEQVRALQLHDEAWLRLDEVRILIAARQRFDRNAVAADFASDRRQVFGGRNDIQFALRERGARDGEP